MGEALDPKKKFIIRKLSKCTSSSSTAGVSSKKVRKLQPTGSSPNSSGGKNGKILQATDSLDKSSTDDECLYRNSNLAMLSIGSKENVDGSIIERESTENEEEIQVVDLEKGEKIHPFLLLLPKLQHHDDFDGSAATLVRTESTMDLSQLMRQQSHESSKFHGTNKRRDAFDLTPLLQNQEIPSSEIMLKGKGKKKRSERIPRPRLDSTDADVSDNDQDDDEQVESEKDLSKS